MFSFEPLHNLYLGILEMLRMRIFVSVIIQKVNDCARETSVTKASDTHFECSSLRM